MTYMNDFRTCAHTWTEIDNKLNLNLEACVMCGLGREETDAGILYFFYYEKELADVSKFEMWCGKTLQEVMKQYRNKDK